jgi:hypothetical protein
MDGRWRAVQLLTFEIEVLEEVLADRGALDDHACRSDHHDHVPKPSPSNTTFTRY